MLLLDASLGTCVKGGVDPRLEVGDAFGSGVRLVGAHTPYGSHMWQDLERPPLSQERLRRDLLESRWKQVHVLAETTSTQEEALHLRGGGDAVVIAEFQSAGRGRRDRTWVSPRQAGITMSLLFEGIEPSPWIGTMVSMAAVEAVNRLSAADATLKWPNDLMLNGKKFGGVISEVHGDAVVVGLGLNVTTLREELPVESATSLRLEDVLIDREPLVKEILRLIEIPLPADIRNRYRDLLSTIGREVKVSTPTEEITDVALDVDDDGRLILKSGQSLAVGDVIHVR